MKELVLLIAAAMTHEQLVEQIKTSIAEWESDKSEENMRKLEMTCALLQMKGIHDMNTKNKGGDESAGVIESLDMMRRVEKVHHLIDSDPLNTKR